MTEQDILRPPQRSNEGARTWRARAAFAAQIVTCLWAVRLLLAWLVSRPLALLVSAGLDDDRVLFEPGALWLAEVLRLRFDQLGGALGSTFWLLAFAWLTLTAVSAWLCAVLARASRVALPFEVSEAAPSKEQLRLATITEAFGLTLRVAPRLVGLGLAWGVVAGVLGVGGAVVLGLLREGPLARSSPVAGDVGLLLGVALLGGVVAALSVVHDLARARVIAHDDSLLAALGGALGVVRAKFLRLAGTRLLLAAGALGLTLASGAVTTELAVEHEGALRLWSVTFLHQATAWLLAATHVAWLWLTLRWTARPQPQA